MSDQPRRPVETPHEWFRYADGDMGVAEREMQSGSPAYLTVCFLCQSAAEKFLKGYLIAQGWGLEKTHDIATLLEACAEYDPNWGHLSAEAAVLNEYVVAGRYPGEIVEEVIGKVEADEAIESANRIRVRVEKLMGISGQGSGDAGVGR